MRTLKITTAGLLVSQFLFAQVGAKIQQQSKIFGVWQNSQFGYEMTLILNGDGSGEFDGEVISFGAEGNKLSLTQAGQTTQYTYTQQGNSLTLAGGDLDGQVVFTRKGGDQPAELTVSQQPLSVGASDQPIVGIWSGNGETIEFRQDGICNYLGSTFQYQLSPGYVTLITAQGNVMFGYGVKGNQLSLSGNNKTVTYTKGANGSVGQPDQQTGKGQVAMELVGKWCWTNVNSYNSGASSSSTCITLNADGSYQYYSESSRSVNAAELTGGTASQNADSGTWWVQGDRIFYNSPTRGQGSYRLEKRNHPKNVNDPMIVLDGEPYVSFYNKPPWR